MHFVYLRDCNYFQSIFLFLSKTNSLLTSTRRLILNVLQLYYYTANVKGRIEFLIVSIKTIKDGAPTSHVSLPWLIGCILPYSALESSCRTHRESYKRYEPRSLQKTILITKGTSDMLTNPVAAIEMHGHGDIDETLQKMRQNILCRRF